MPTYRTTKSKNYRTLINGKKWSSESHTNHQRTRFWNYNHSTIENTWVGSTLSIGKCNSWKWRENLCLWMWSNRKTFNRPWSSMETIDQINTTWMEWESCIIYGRWWCCFNQISRGFRGSSRVRRATFSLIRI